MLDFLQKAKKRIINQQLKNWKEKVGEDALVGSPKSRSEVDHNKDPNPYKHM